MGKNQSKEEQPKEEIIKTVEKIVYVEKPEINVSFTKANSHDFKTLEEEEEFLMYHKNEVLQTQLNQVRKKFETVQSLDQVIDFKEKKDEQINNKSLLEINDNEKYCFCEYKTYLKINFNLIGLLFVKSNLIGVYQLIGILKSLLECNPFYLEKIELLLIMIQTQVFHLIQLIILIIIVKALKIFMKIIALKQFQILIYYI